MAKIRQMLITIIYVLSHLKLKIILKNRFISPCPYVLANHQKDSCPLFIMNSMQLVVDILKDLQSKEKKLVI